MPRATAARRGWPERRPTDDARRRGIRSGSTASRHAGFEGDTVGSALAGDDVGSCAQLQVPPAARAAVLRRPLPELPGGGGRAPNVRACVTPLREGMDVRPQNAWPSLRWTCCRSPTGSTACCPSASTTRRSSGRAACGRCTRACCAAPAVAGPSARPDAAAGSTRATRHLSHGRRGGRRRAGGLPRSAGGGGGRAHASCSSTMQPRLGGHLRGRGRARSMRATIGRGLRGREAAAAAGGTGRGGAADRAPRAGATAVGIYEGGLVGVTQGGRDRSCASARRRSSSRRARQERPGAVRRRTIVPGVMLASGVLRLAHGFSRCSPASRAVVVTDDDHGGGAGRGAARRRASRCARWSTPRPDAEGASRPSAAGLRQRGVEILRGARPVRTTGRGRGRARCASHRGRRADELDCDLVAMAMRPEPVAQPAGAGRRRDVAGTTALGEFVPSDPAAGSVCSPPATCWAAWTTRARRARRSPRAGRRRRAGQPEVRPALPRGSLDGGADQLVAHDARWPRRSRPARRRRSSSPGRRKQFVCLCEDVTAKELEQAFKEGFTDLETLKRYSTVTMGPCQGKMCHGLVGPAPRAARRASPARPASTTARPPFQPVPLASWPDRTTRASGAPRCTSGTTRWARRGSTWASGSGRSTTAT